MWVIFNGKVHTSVHNIAIFWMELCTKCPALASAIPWSDAPPGALTESTVTTSASAGEDATRRGRQTRALGPHHPRRVWGKSRAALPLRLLFLALALRHFLSAPKTKFYCRTSEIKAFTSNKKRKKEKRTHIAFNKDTRNRFSFHKCQNFRALPLFFVYETWFSVPCKATFWTVEWYTPLFEFWVRRSYFQS